MDSVSEEKTAIAPKYTPKWPETFDDASVKQWIHDYYSAIDNKASPQAVVDLFTEDAVIELGKRRINRSTMLQASRSSWDDVESRRHNPQDAYPLGDNTYLIEGNATYVYKNGQSRTFEWCGKLRLVMNDGKWQMNYYKTYFATEY
ncbi:uncharacterized protein BO80DRAFT_469460 [Aspergillus ibericus CBS 121593]|uniref:Uncharacterized protein n=1 Tax=Aspergillus ibericus CBS 121593 TaxID=1448316 RepID=A0A395GIR1_9EURO|nr:hypothetical protein BO80DRAFT_469460 [Aspergillus ibericus CBS 121593]RAK95345.1 hypothetical protein BO80DRAFT_469460 [Aspergillus ibericus CBS 121593]